MILETVALLQRRVSLAAVSNFQMKSQPLLDVIWVDAEWHAKAMQRLLAQTDRALSLVDCLSFEIMEVRGLTTAYTFDSHFEENGFTIAVFHDLDRF